METKQEEYSNPTRLDLAKRLNRRASELLDIRSRIRDCNKRDELSERVTRLSYEALALKEAATIPGNAKELYEEWEKKFEEVIDSKKQRPKEEQWKLAEEADKMHKKAYMLKWAEEIEEKIKAKEGDYARIEKLNEDIKPEEVDPVRAYIIDQYLTDTRDAGM